MKSVELMNTTCITHEDVRLTAIIRGPLLLKCDSGWRYKSDPENQGIARRWLDEDISKAWLPVTLNQTLEHQDNDVASDVAWYGLDFNLPGNEIQTDAWLVFYKVTGQATVWLNGMPVGAHTTDRYRLQYEEPHAWALNINEHCRMGCANRLIMRVEGMKNLVYNMATQAGLYAPVEIHTELSDSEFRKLKVADLKTSICMNHIGFLPHSPKYFTVMNPLGDEFEILKGGQSVFRGTLRKVQGDFGDGAVGDFSPLTEEGYYTVLCRNARPCTFTIGKSLYHQSLRILYNFFPAKRCGPDSKGYTGPCHANDAFHADNFERIDLTGGWHQSGDHRKRAWGHGSGVMGLSRLGLLKPFWDDGLIADELRWGIQYIQKLIRPDGGMMGGPDEGPEPGNSLVGKMNEFRFVDSTDTSPWGMYASIDGLCLAAKYFSDSSQSAVFAEQCVAQAIKIWNYLVDEQHFGRFNVASYLGGGVIWGGAGRRTAESALCGHGVVRLYGG